MKKIQEQTQDWLAARTRSTPNATALIFNERQWTYAQLENRVQNCAIHLNRVGIRPGDKVAVLLPNCVDYVVLIHGLARLGAVLAPLNTRLTVAELSWQIDHTRAARLIYDDTTVQQALAAQRDSGITLQHVTELQQPAKQGLPFQSHPLDLNAPQSIVFTSGTTGRPKGAVLTFANHFWSATASSYRLGLQTNDCWLSCLPLYHVGGLAVIFRSCLYGTAIVLHQGFDLDTFSHSLQSQPVTLTSLVPTMLHRLLHIADGAALRSEHLRMILLGGAAASIDLLTECHEMGIPVAPTYGLTEAGSQVATLHPTEMIHKLGSVGKPLMFSALDIVDEQGQPLPSGTLGEVVVRGPTIMAEYYANSAATEQCIRNGALYSGDIGYLDDEGDLWLVQRRSDIIVSGGENVYPSEVEAVLDQHPLVNRSCVVGLPDAEWGQQVAAMVEVDAVEPGLLTVEALTLFSRQHLAGYKQPRTILFVEQLPQTASGKIARRAVAEMLQLEENF